jgi:hypothetical protein
MWQPKHPASEVVATRSLRFFGALVIWPSSARHRDLADGALVVRARADGHAEAPALAAG